MTARRSPGLSPTQSALVQITAALLLTVVLLTALEIISGLFVARWAKIALNRHVPGDTVSETLAWLEINPAPLIRDVDLLWRNEPLARKTLAVNPRAFGRKDQWTIENNSEGFRGPERSPGAGDDRIYRVLCVGDSVTFGFNADQDATYPKRLEQLLLEQHPTDRFEVINAGVPGWSWIQGLRFLEIRGFALEPDVIVVAHGTNDQTADMPARVTDEERFHRLAGSLQHSVQSVGLRLSRTNIYRAVEWLARRREPAAYSPACRKQIAETGRCQRVSLDEIQTAVSEVGRLAKAHGIDLLVMNLDFLETGAVEAVHRAVESEGIPFLDLVERVNALRKAEENARAAQLGLAPARQAPRGNTALVNKVVLRVVVPHRLKDYTVKGAALAGTREFAFDEPMYDDGTHGDEVGADGVFSATVAIPAEVTAIRYKFFEDAVAEFVPLPPLPSTFGERSMRLPGDVVAPVVIFAELRFMAERTHPDAEGHAIIAEAVTRELETSPSFERFTNTGPPVHESKEIL